MICSHATAYRTGVDNPLTSASAVITATTLQLLPPLHRLMKLLSIWAIRCAVLKIVPVFLRWLDNAKHALAAGYEAIRLPAIVSGEQKLDEEIFAVMAENIQHRVTAAGRIMDSMLDALEGREDVLPDKWIGELEEIEEGVSNWEMDAERVVLEGRLREVTKAEEFRNEREMMQLVMEGERVAEEVREDEDAIDDVLEKVGEIERGLLEALEAQEDVQEGIEIEGQTSEDDEPAPTEPSSSVGLGLDRSLLKRLREVKSSEIEADRGRRWRRTSSVGSLGDGSPGSPIKSPDFDTGRRRLEAETREGFERRSFFDTAFGERMKEWSRADPSPTVIMTGFDIAPPTSPHSTSEASTEQSITRKIAPMVLPLLPPPQLDVSTPTSELTKRHTPPSVALHPLLRASPVPPPLPVIMDEDEVDPFMTPPLGLGEVAVHTPATVPKLAGS